MAEGGGAARECPAGARAAGAGAALAGAAAHAGGALALRRFVFDAHFAVETNALVHGGADLGEFLRRDFWGQDLTSASSHKSWRPLATLGFRLQHWASGGQPWAFHMGSVALHAAASASVVALGYALPHEPGSSGAGSLDHVRLAALLFAVHPVHVESVAGIVGQADSLCCIFFCLAIVLFASSRVVCDAQHSRRFVCVLLALFCAVLSTLSKEVGLTVLGCFVALDWLLPPPVQPVGQLQTRFAKSSSIWMPKLVRLGCCLVIAWSYVRLREWITGGDHLVPMIYERKVENPIPFLSRLPAALTTAYVHARYAGLLIFPAYLSADWSHACLGTVEDVWDLRNIYSCALYGSILFAALKARPWCFSLRQAGFTGPLPSRIASFYIILAALPYLPASNLLFPVGTMVAERLLYLPSVGFCLLAAMGLLRLPKGWGRRTLIALLVTLSVGRTVTQDAAWVSDKSLWVAAERTCPGSAKIHSQLGILAENEGRYNDALAHSLQARLLEPTYCDPTYNIALALWHLPGQKMSAIESFRKALHCKWTRSAAYENLGRIVEHMLRREPRNSLAHGVALEVTADLQLTAGNKSEAITSYFAASESFWRAGDMERALFMAKRGSVLARSEGPNSCPLKRPRGRSRPFSDEYGFEAEWELRSRECFKIQAGVVTGLHSGVGINNASGGTPSGGAPVSETGISSYIASHLSPCRDSYTHHVVIHMLLNAAPRNALLQREWGELMFLHGQPAAAREHLYASTLLFFEARELGGDGALLSLQRLLEVDKPLSCALASRARALAQGLSQGAEERAIAEFQELADCKAEQQSSAGVEND